MKQILQNLKNGKVELAEFPCPRVEPGQLLIQTRASLISAGTERMLVEFGKASLLAKARSQPEKVKQVLDKLRTDGLMPTMEAVFRKLGEPLPLGYCNAGTIVSAELRAGDRVVSNGPHAEMVSVPARLCAKIPDAVSDEAAAFAVLASVGLQGIRLANPTAGERVVVYGLGLVGLMTVQILRARGHEVFGIDLNTDRLKLAEQFGATVFDASSDRDPVPAVSNWSDHAGAHAVLITASANKDDIVHRAAQMCRKQGRIILVGVVDLNLRRSDFYEKELTFRVSCSYGPDRYDEQENPDSQQWTVRDNFDTVLNMMAEGHLDVAPLISHRFSLAQAPSAYEKIIHDSRALGVILDYGPEVNRSTTVRVTDPQSAAAAVKAVVGVIGAGNFSRATLLPNLRKTNVRIKSIADLKPNAAADLAEKYTVENATTDYTTILDDPDISAVFVAVQHDLHAKLICEALQAGKHVFCEKPLCLNTDELQRITTAYDSAFRAPHPPFLMVGFNRRFSPHTIKVKELLARRTEPLCMSMTVNAGEIPQDHWVHDPQQGGGRIVGEACHFIDLLSHVAGSPVATVSATMVGEGPAIREDKMSIVLGLADGSVGIVNYFANGAKSYPKETLEVFSDGRILRVENFRKTLGFGFSGFRRLRTSRQDKGHRHEVAAFVNRIGTGVEQLIPFEQLVNVTRATFAAVESARENRAVRL